MIRRDPVDVVWRPVVGWPEYEVSDDGQVRRVVTHTVDRRRPKRTFANPDGIVTVQLCRGSRKVCVVVARLVLEAFGRPPARPSYTVAYRNGNTRDLRVENLAWKARGGFKHKLTYELAQEIRAARAQGESRAALAQRFGVKWKAIWAIDKNVSWAST